jgi:excinuclease UvrABC nuclease subunit
MWKKFRLIDDFDKLPLLPGVYCIYINNEIVYIGSSVNIKKRIGEYKFESHCKKYNITPWQFIDKTLPIFVKISLSKKLGDWAMKEIRLISKLQPKFNKSFKNKNLRTK